MKKLLVILSLLIMIFACTACQSNSGTGSSGKTDAPSTCTDLTMEEQLEILNGA